MCAKKSIIMHNLLYFMHKQYFEFTCSHPLSLLQKTMQFFAPLFVNCSSRVDILDRVNITCSSNQLATRLRITECTLDNDTPLRLCKSTLLRMHAHALLYIHHACTCTCIHSPTRTYIPDSNSA